MHWSSYTPEEQGVVIAYASIYGNTANAADVLACRLRERGVRTEVFDVSVTPASEIIAAAFKYSHLVFAAPTYNSGVFVTMEGAADGSGRAQHPEPHGGLYGEWYLGSESARRWARCWKNART